VASYYCRQGKHANFGEGDSPTEAMRAAIADAGNSAYCEFKAVRGPQYGMELMTKPWKGTCNCGERRIALERTGHVKVDSAVMVVNEALTQCAGRAPFEIVEVNIVQ
jgi:hypothetical protein